LTGLNAACKNPRTEAQLYEEMLGSPFPLALVYVALSALVLGLFAIPLWCREACMTSTSW